MPEKRTKYDREFRDGAVRIVQHARTRTLKLPPGWAWAADISAAWARLQALHLG